LSFQRAARELPGLSQMSIIIFCFTELEVSPLTAEESEILF